MDLTHIRLNAHLNYILPRIDDENKAKEFVNAVICLINNEPVAKDKHGGADMAVDIYNEIVQIHRERFEEGRSGDALLEKL